MSVFILRALFLNRALKEEKLVAPTSKEVYGYPQKITSPESRCSPLLSIN